MKPKLDSTTLRNLTRTRRKTSHKKRIEQTILNVQQYFLTAGPHHISVRTHEQGRSLLRVCLDSLSMYEQVGMVTVSTKKAPYQYVDIYEELQYANATSLDTSKLDEYMCSSFQCDFLVLEYTQQLIEQPWFGRFEQLLSEYSVLTSIPVILLFYDEHEVIEN